MEKIYILKEIATLVDNVDSEIQSKENHNNDSIHKMDVRLSVVESNINIISKQTEILHTGETKTQKNIRNMFVIGAGFVTVFGFISYQANADKIDFEIKKVEDKLASLEGKNIVISASISAVGSREGYAIANAKIERLNANDGLHTYSLTLIYEGYVGVIGDGIGKLMGFYKKYDGNYPLLIAADKNNVFRDNLIKGSATYFDTVDIKEGYPYHFSWSETIIRGNCKEIDDLLDVLRKNKNLGDVYIEPFFETIKNKPMLVSFHIEIGQTISVQGCEDFK